MDTDRMLRRAREAEALLDHTLLREAFEMLEKATLAQWRFTAPGDTATRERLWQQLATLDLVRQQLKSIVTTGRLIQAREDAALKPQPLGE